MPRKQPFIPRDKPKFFVVAILFGLIGIAVGLLAFVAGSLGLVAVENLLRPAFFICWCVMAFCMAGFLAKQWGGRYHTLQERPWKEQQW